MTLISVYAQKDKIIVISDGRQIEYKGQEIMIVNENVDKVIVTEEGFVVGMAGLSVLGTDKFGDVNMSNIVEHFINMNRKYLNLSAQKLLEGLVETVKRTITESLNMDYKTHTFQLTYIVTKWTNGYPEIVSYHSHLDTGEYINKFENVGFLKNSSALIGKCGDINTILEHRKIDIEDYSFEDGINLILSLYSKIEKQEPSVGGNKKIYILNQNCEDSYWYTHK